MTKLEDYHEIRCQLIKKYLGTLTEDIIVQGGLEKIIYTGDPIYPYAEVTFKPLTLQGGQERIRYIAEREISLTETLTERKLMRMEGEKEE